MARSYWFIALFTLGAVACRAVPAEVAAPPAPVEDAVTVVATEAPTLAAVTAALGDAELSQFFNAEVARARGRVDAARSRERLDKQVGISRRWKIAGLTFGATTTTSAAIGALNEDNAKAYATGAAILGGLATIATYFIEEKDREERINACREVVTKGNALVDNFETVWSGRFAAGVPAEGEGRQRFVTDLQRDAVTLTTGINGLPHDRCR